MREQHTGILEKISESIQTVKIEEPLIKSFLVIVQVQNDTEPDRTHTHILSNVTHDETMQLFCLGLKKIESSTRTVLEN